MSEEKKRKREESAPLELKEETLEYMLSIVKTPTLIKMLLKTFKPGNDVYEEFIESVSSEIDFTKLFLFDLSYNVTADMIRAEYSRFGEIREVKLVVDKVKGTSKGFGFVVFVSPESLLKAFEADVILDNRTVKMKYACASESAPRWRTQPSENPVATIEPPKMLDEDREKRKIYVGNVDLEWRNDDILRYFQKFGEVTEAFICYEKGTMHSRGFGFVTYASMDGVNECLKEPIKEYNGKKMNCSAVSSQPRKERNPRKEPSRYRDDDDRNDRNDRNDRYDRNDRDRGDRGDRGDHGDRKEHRDHRDSRYEDRRDRYDGYEDRRDYYDGYHQPYYGNYSDPYYPPPSSYPPPSYPPQDGYQNPPVSGQGYEGYYNYSPSTSTPNRPADAAQQPPSYYGSNQPPTY